MDKEERSSPASEPRQRRLKIARYAAPQATQEPRCKCRVDMQKKGRVPPGTAEDLGMNAEVQGRHEAEY